MIKKEFRDILWPALLRFSVVLLTPIFIIIRRQFQLIPAILTWGLVPIVIWMAHNLGINSFKAEYRDQALEYLLTFPLSRWRILWRKLIPRLALLLALLALYEVMYFLFLKPFVVENAISSEEFILFLPQFFPLWVAFIFGTALSISIFDWKNFKILAGFSYIFLAVLISLAIRSLLARQNWSGVDLNATSFLGGCLLVMAVMGISFITVYSKFDVKENMLFLKRFIFRAFLPLLPFVLVSLYILRP